MKHPISVSTKPASGHFDGFPVVAKSKPVDSVKNAWHAAREAAGLDDRVTSYSRRHTAARRMRQSRVSGWDIATQLGHKLPGVTETYTAFHPDYLKSPSRALDKLVCASCERLPQRESFTATGNSVEVQRVRWEKMVGATGIEPVTPPV
jgi:hypothetical protein